VANKIIFIKINKKKKKTGIIAIHTSRSYEDIFISTFERKRKIHKNNRQINDYLRISSPYFNLD